MILKLRQRHRLIIPVLGVLIAMMFVLGIAVRRPIPEAETLPPELLPQSYTFSATGFDRDDLFNQKPIRVRLWREHEKGIFAVSFSAAKDFLKPDLMAYWSAIPPGTKNTLPADATLLGAFIAGPLVLPDAASTTDGRLILFSVANQEIVDFSKPVRFNDSMN